MNNFRKSLSKKLVVFFCIWCVLSIAVIERQAMGKETKFHSQDSQQTQINNQVQAQQRKRDPLEEEGERQVEMFRNAIKWLNAWGIYLIIGMFSVGILGKIITRRNKIMPKKIEGGEQSYGSARFAYRKEIKHLLRTFGKGGERGELLVGKYEETWRPTNKLLYLDRDLVKRHTLVLGPSGSGKSRSIFLPNCVADAGSFIATDPKSELWKNTSGTRMNPIRFAPKDPDASREFNFIASCKDQEVAEKVAAAIVQKEGDRGDQYWTISEQQLLEAAIMHIANSKIPTPAHLYELLTSGGEVIGRELSNSQVESTRRLSRSYIELEEKIKTIIAQAIVGKMKWLENEKVRRFTSSTKLEFDFGNLRKTATQIYWCLEEDDISVLQPLTTIFFTLALTKLKKSKGEVPVTLYLDEFANIGKLANFETDITILRGRDIGIVAGIQSISQLETIYGKSKAETIFGNFNSKIVLSGLEIDTAEKISKLTGDSTYREMTESRSRKGGFLRGEETITESQNAHSRRLLTADEVRRFDKKKLLLVSTDLPPISLTKLTYQLIPKTASVNRCNTEMKTPKYEGNRRKGGTDLGLPPMPDFPQGI